MRLKNQKRYPKGIWKKIAVMIFLLAVFAADLIYVSFYRDAGTADNPVNTESSGEKDTGKKAPGDSKGNDGIMISNLERYAGPLLGGEAGCLDTVLKDFCAEENKSDTGAEIFYVMIPEENENRLYFFVKLHPSEEIVRLIYDHETVAAACQYCEYTEEEIVNETWLGNGPFNRDEG